MHENKIQLRREVIDWRDKNIENIYNHLNRESATLFRDIDNELENFGLVDIFKNKSFFKKQIEPIYLQWIDNESRLLINIAQRELNKIFQHEINHRKQQDNLQYKQNNNCILDITTGALSTGAVAAVIPTLISTSTTTASAGGLLGLLGATTLAINWPIVLAGGASIVTLSYLGIYKFGNIKSNAMKRLQKDINKIIYDKNDLICKSLQSEISKTSEVILVRLKNE